MGRYFFRARFVPKRGDQRLQAVSQLLDHLAPDQRSPACFRLPHILSPLRPMAIESMGSVACITSTRTSRDYGPDASRSEGEQ